MFVEGSNQIIKKEQRAQSNRVSAFIRVTDTYGEAIRECALQRRDSGRLHLRFVFRGLDT
ncbi:MAG: hypothetical protein O8C66_03925 [Candidatus Methanoperedens sp.]|nr:hypothetical protein [Candidatus Methanoperedens sp.]MCZ7369635.1 hypothetical protein [Candidatus Methanoperedens sp.]